MHTLLPSARPYVCICGQESLYKVDKKSASTPRYETTSWGAGKRVLLWIGSADKSTRWLLVSGSASNPVTSHLGNRDQHICSYGNRHTFPESTWLTSHLYLQVEWLHHYLNKRQTPLSPSPPSPPPLSSHSYKCYNGDFLSLEGGCSRHLRPFQSLKLKVMSNPRSTSLCQCNICSKAKG